MVAVIIVSVIFLLAFYFLALKIIKRMKALVDNTNSLSFENFYNFAGIGVIIYDEAGNIIYANDYLRNLSKKEIIGLSITKWIPDLYQLINQSSQKLNLTYEGIDFQAKLFPLTRAVILKDISNYQQLLTKTSMEKPVIALLGIDNLRHTINLISDSKGITINNAIKKQIVDWALANHILLRFYTDESAILVMNEIDYSSIASNNFEILELIKKKAKQYKVDLSLSLGVGYGNSNYNLLYEYALKNLELAQARGGDQAIVRNHFYPDLTYYGHQKPTIKSSSQIEIRKFSSRLATAMKSCSNILISGHKFADFDCIASTLCFYYIAKSYNNNVKIYLDFKCLDKNARNNINKIIPSEIIEEAYISSNKLKDYVTDKTLIIVGDTHVPERMEVNSVLDQTENIIVIDHHIRNPNQIEKVRDLFIEPTASSTSEISIEIKIYQDKEIPLPKWLATLLLTGIMMDTNFFRMRTGSRTFAASSYLQKKNANFIQAQNLLKTDINEQKLIFNVLKNAIKAKEKVFFTAADESEVIDRSTLAQIAQNLIQIQNSFVGIAIGVDPSGTPCMSVRSNGLANVISFAIALKGGGHFDAAAAQGEGMTYADFKKLVLETIEKWDFNIESNTN